MIKNLEARIAALEAENASLQKQLNAALQRIEELMELLGQNSGNSSKPPSLDSPAQRKSRRKNKKGSKRNRGGQPGHVGTTRKKAPPEDVGDTLKYIADGCERCGQSFDRTESVRVVAEHQVWDILVGPMTVTEHHSCGVSCSCCGAETVEPIPAGVPRSNFGPNVTALISYLVGNCRMSRRKVRQMLSEIFQLDISLGAISECEKRVADAIEPAVEELRESALSAPIKHMDLTGWAEGGERRQILTVVTESAVVFWILDDGGRVTLQSAIGEPDGVLISDRGTVFDHWPIEQRQACLAHIKRAFEAMAGRKASSAIGRDLGALLDLVFHVWHEHKEGEGLDQGTLKTWQATFTEQLAELLVTGVETPHKKTSGTCQRLFRQLPMLFTFLSTPGVEPTNNAAERALRHFVIWSNTCYGSQSKRGSRFAADIMSVVETLRTHGRSVFDYLRRAILAGLQDQPPPKLLPGT